MKQRKQRWLKVLLVLLLVGVAADVTVRLLQPVDEKAPSRCLSIPTRFILEYPECTQRLVEAANVTNVRIMSNDSLADLIENRSRGWREESRKRYNMT